eukprot:6176736-Pleurochrysis_carterae.AAC.4
MCGDTARHAAPSSRRQAAPLPSFPVDPLFLGTRLAHSLSSRLRLPPARYRRTVDASLLEVIEYNTIDFSSLWLQFLPFRRTRRLPDASAAPRARVRLAASAHFEKMNHLHFIMRVVTEMRSQPQLAQWVNKTFGIPIK